MGTNKNHKNPIKKATYLTAAILPFPSHSQQSPPPDMEKNVTKHINIESRKKNENPV
jgi:hypothetical protein